MDDFLNRVKQDGVFISSTTYGRTEINLYRLNGKPIEIWFDHVSESVTKVRELLGVAINPYIKYINNEHRDN